MEVLSENEPIRVEQMQRAALDVESAVRNISTLTTVSGTVGNTLLFSNVITYYQAKINAINLAIQTKEAAYEQGLWANPPLKQTTPFQLYAGIDQAVTSQTTEHTTITCGDASAHGNYPAPSNLKSLIPNFNRYNLAEYLGLGKITTCLSSDYLETREECHTAPDTGAFICDPYGKHKASITVYFNGMSIMSQSIIEGEDYVPTYDPSEIKWHWTLVKRYKEQFEAMSTVDAPTPALAAQQAALYSALTASLEDWFESKQQTFYRQIEHELSSAGLRPVAIETAGGKALLNSFVTLGLSRAVQEDELLRAMLYGNQQLVDDQQIIQSYILSATRPITGTALLMNPRVSLMQVADQRTAAFSAIIGNYLNAITARTHRESLDYIANTRRELDLTVRIAQLDAPQQPNPDPDPNPVPGEPKRVFLPLVNR